MEKTVEELRSLLEELNSPSAKGNVEALTKFVHNLGAIARALPALLDRLASVEKELEESKARVKMLKYGFNIPNDGTTEQRTLKEIIRFCYTDGPMTEMFPDPEDFLPEEEGLTPEQVDAQLRMAGYTDADFDRMHKKVAAVLEECRAKAAAGAGDSGAGVVEK